MNSLQLQRYEIKEKIGIGGMADVFLAYDKVLERECAIKLLRQELCQDPIAKMRFMREAEAASVLQHRNIVSIYDVGEANNRPFIVMEYVSGMTLKSMILKRGAIEKSESLMIMKQLVMALDAAHQLGIIHRDIKPQNVLVKADGTVKIADFGIASVQGSIQLTQHDSVMGSVHYLAPECVRGEHASFESDIYSLGIVFYEMLTGNLPYQGEGALQVAMKHLKEDMRSVRDYNANIEQSIENIIIKSTAKNKKYRYHDAKELIKDLEECLLEKNLNVEKLVFNDEENSNPTVVFVKDSTDNKKPVPKSRFKWYYPLIAVILVLVIVVLVYIFSLNNNKDVIELVKVPNVVKLPIDQAKNMLIKDGFLVDEKVLYQLSSSVAKDSVIKTIPESTSELAKGSTISLVVSRGISYDVEDLKGLTVEEAREKLKVLPKIDIKIVYEPSNEYKTGIVIRQENLLAGSVVEFDRFHEITLVVSGNPQFIVPNVIGKNILDAKKELESLGAKVELKALDVNNLSYEDRLNLNYDVVVTSNPSADSNYVQNDNSRIVLEYYANSNDDKNLGSKLKDLISRISRIDISALSFSQKYEYDQLVLKANRALELNDSSLINNAINDLTRFLKGIGQ